MKPEERLRCSKITSVGCIDLSVNSVPHELRVDSLNVSPVESIENEAAIKVLSVEDVRATVVYFKSDVVKLY